LSSRLEESGPNEAFTTLSRWRPKIRPRAQRESCSRARENKDEEREDRPNGFGMLRNEPGRDRKML
jgi:hypothetical protein